MTNEVYFNKDGFVFLQIYLKHRITATMQLVVYKVDSGANCTTISRTELVKLGYDDDWIRSGRSLSGANSPTVASGLPIEHCYEVIIPKIRIGNWVGYNWPVLTSLIAYL